SGCGAVLDLGAIAPPPGIELLPWLLSFPSYGYLLSVRPGVVAEIQCQFHDRGLVCNPIGTITPGQTLTLQLGAAALCFWDFATESLTGFAPEARA
ncbi:MAG: hypothetical protein AAFW95_09295, partial [Cyanobacteria bacterium J06638_6]